jgi:hypothetical protein
LPPCTLQAYSPLGSSEKNLAHDPAVEKVPLLIQWTTKHIAFQLNWSSSLTCNSQNI